MAILIGLAVAVTLIPALLAIGGRAIFWPHRPGVELSPTDAAEETPTLETQGSSDRGRTHPHAASRSPPSCSLKTSYIWTRRALISSSFLTASLPCTSGMTACRIALAPSPDGVPVTAFISLAACEPTSKIAPSVSPKPAPCVWRVSRSVRGGCGPMRKTPLVCGVSRGYA
jgi:hypothetical protein